MRFFTDHPAAVGESYFEHMRKAFGFGSAMLKGGIACMVHGLMPSLFVCTGSRTVQRLHEQMVTARAGKQLPAQALDFVI